MRRWENGAGTVCGERNIERGAGGGMSRENVVLRKLVKILVLYGAGAEVDVETVLVLKTIYPVSKLTFKSTRGTVLYWCDTKLAILILSLLGDYPSGRQ